MTCNTAHYAIEEISQSVDLPFIDLIKEVVKFAKMEQKINIGVMASDGAVRTRVYDMYFSNYFSEAKIIYPNSDMQKKLTKGIVNIKNQNRFNALTNEERPNFIFKEVCEHLVGEGADLIISGCTDIRVDFSEHDCSVKVIDSLDVLVDIIYDMYNSGRAL